MASRMAQTQQQPLFCWVVILRYNFKKKEGKEKMSNYKVIGYEHKEGISKKTKQPYCIDIIHCIVEQRLDEFGNGRGNRVESVVYNALINGSLMFVPEIGDIVEIYYSRNGFVTNIFPVKE